MWCGVRLEAGNPGRRLQGVSRQQWKEWRSGDSFENDLEFMEVKTLCLMTILERGRAPKCLGNFQLD